jgi:hypothetical protein
MHFIKGINTGSVMSHIYNVYIISSTLCKGDCLLASAALQTGGYNARN